MGIAIISGVIASLELREKTSAAERPSQASTSGDTTPTSGPILQAEDAAIPSKFIACVSRHESARKLRRTFGDLGPFGQDVEVLVDQNLDAFKRCNVALLW